MRAGICAILLVMLLASFAWCADDLIANGNFAQGLQNWEPYGRDQGLIRYGKGEGPNGADCAVLPVGHASIAETMNLKPRTVYELSVTYRRSLPSTKCGLVFFLNKTGGINASAGVINLDFPQEAAKPTEWETFREALRTPTGTTKGKVVLSARGSGEVHYSQVILREITPEKIGGNLLLNSDWSTLARTRTASPLFDELLSDSPGNYTVVAWTHNMNKKNLPASMADKYTDEQWKAEQEIMYREAGEVGMNHYSLPWQGDIAGEMHERFGMKFDVMCESSAVTANAIKAGAEVVNPTASSKTSAKPAVSFVDPVYVNTAVEELKKHVERFKGQPFIFAYCGEDEPSILMPEGPIAKWRPFGKRCADEVLNYYGFGKYEIPARDDPGYQEDEANHPFRWIAFNRWMADKYADTKKEMYNALKSVDPNAKYSPCDYWFMSGFTPYDFALMAKYSDIVECDPYASSGERIKGRGLYNHGFGPKFLRDITGKPVRSIIQAFDYAGYEMTPEDLREWMSQSLRAGASHISYYQMDNPRFNDPERWKMMLYLSKMVTNMKALKLPDDPEVAILYSSDTHRSHGSSTKANELYTAYSLLGERVGSWFDFVDDDSLVRGEKSLSKYKAIYIPLGTYQRESIVKMIEEFVKDGGTVICGDPAVFSWDINGNDLSSYREKIFGIRTIKPTSRTSMNLKPQSEILPVFRPVGRDGWPEDNGWLVEISKPGVQTLATFTDGTPGITSVKYGKGEAIYFAANPFVPECLFEGNRWDGFFLALQKHIGAKVDRPIWHFKIPAPKD